MIIKETEDPDTGTGLGTGNPEQDLRQRRPAPPIAIQTVDGTDQQQKDEQGDPPPPPPYPFPDAPAGKQDQIKPRRRRKRLQWRVDSTTQTKPPSPAQESTFLTMQLRKMRRRVHGRKVKGDILKDVCVLFTIIIIIFLLGAFKVIWLLDDYAAKHWLLLLHLPQLPMRRMMPSGPRRRHQQHLSSFYCSSWFGSYWPF